MEILDVKDKPGEQYSATPMAKEAMPILAHSIKGGCSMNFLARNSKNTIPSDLIAKAAQAMTAIP